MWPFFCTYASVLIYMMIIQTRTIRKWLYFDTSCSISFMFHNKLRKFGHVFPKYHQIWMMHWWFELTRQILPPPPFKEQFLFLIKDIHRFRRFLDIHNLHFARRELPWKNLNEKISKHAAGDGGKQTVSDAFLLQQEYTIKHCQRHNRPEGWALFAKVTLLGHIQSFLSPLSFLQHTLHAEKPLQPWRITSCGR